MNWRNRTKDQLIAYKGGKCIRCGFNKPIRACYVFHHINPSEKEFGISGKSLSFERLKLEVDKCQLLCHNCHAELHYEEQEEKRQTRLKIRRVYLENNICLGCGNKYKPRRKNQKYCGQACKKFKYSSIPQPNKEELSEDLKNMTWVAMGKKYGVSDNGVRHWAKKYGLISK